jgi:(2Fe-2S) ferredoxin
VNWRYREQVSAEDVPAIVAELRSGGEAVADGA